MNPALRLSDRHSLDPMRTALELESSPHARAAHYERHISEPAHVAVLAAEKLKRPPGLRGHVRPVHLEEVAGPDVRLLAAFSALDLDDDVTSVIGIGRQQEHFQSLFELRCPI